MQPNSPSAREGGQITTSVLEIVKRGIIMVGGPYDERSTGVRICASHTVFHYEKNGLYVYVPAVQDTLALGPSRVFVSDWQVSSIKQSLTSMR